jgi:hypothetical protein
MAALFLLALTPLPETDRVPSVTLQEASAAVNNKRELNMLIVGVALVEWKDWPVNSLFSLVHVYCCQGI